MPTQKFTLPQSVYIFSNFTSRYICTLLGWLFLIAPQLQKNAFKYYSLAICVQLWVWIVRFVTSYFFLQFPKKHWNECNWVTFIISNFKDQMFFMHFIMNGKSFTLCDITSVTKWHTCAALCACSLPLRSLLWLERITGRVTPSILDKLCRFGCAVFLASSQEETQLTCTGNHAWKTEHTETEAPEILGTHSARKLASTYLFNNTYGL